MAADLLYKVAYDEAVRALSEQREMIDGLRSRAGLFFSAAAVTTSFLGAQALQGGKLNLFCWLALTGFVGVAMAIIAILWPRQWEFTANPHEVIGVFIESTSPVSLEELHRELAIDMEAGHLRNSAGLEKLIVYFQVANVLLAVEVILWTIAIVLSA
jgi:hypothetical protein